MAESPSPDAPTETAGKRSLGEFFARLRRIRNLSLGVGAVGTGVLLGSAYKPMGAPVTTLAATLTTLALSTAATAQVLLSLNEQLEVALNQPARKPTPGVSNS
ncbi:MAG: hypothetical protein ACO1RX_10345 [Candidatus Sericytochromatia bacterium]